ncbi:hypothetical protein M0802_013963 [Mischocyttarus mexicanus]|nr:hypothetical protein M0802_013963 [Mischocyttarus mexicanus]
MVLETNKYYEKCALQTHSSVTIRKHKQQWKPITRDEMHILIGILLIMGIVKVPEIRLYWSKDLMFSNERKKSAMLRERYFDILRH